MAEKAYYVTEEGLAALQAELEDLKVNRRKEVAEKIKEALSFGDLSENSEYDEAKNDQAILEARIADLEVMVSNARVIEKENLAADTVHIGSSVFVKTKRADGSEAERSFSIVGSNEANPRQGKISDESAVGKALVGAKVGQTVEVETPAGIVEYTDHLRILIENQAVRMENPPAFFVTAVRRGKEGRKWQKRRPRKRKRN